LGQGKMLFALLAYQQADSPEKVVEVEKLLRLSAQERQTDENTLH
jgi:hypothetical protein